MMKGTMEFRLHLFLLLAVGIVATNAEDDSCEQPSRYYIPNVEIDWVGAVEYCNRLNMRLAIVDSQSKHDTIVDLIKVSDAYVPNATNVWIGANDISREGTFVWHATGLRTNYTNWSVNNPNNDGVENCAEIAYRGYTNWTWTWNDHKCHTLLHFVCEF